MKTIVRFPFIAVVAWTLFLSSAWSSPPEVSADSAILIDAETGTVLMEKKPDRPYFPASITKIMTAHLALKHGDLDDPITVSRKAAYGIEPGSSSIALKPGEKVTLRDVLYGLMLRSANECGNIIAEYVSGSNAAFAGEMNREAKRLGCTGTRFKNPHGLHHPDHVVTARGMALISREAMKNPDFRKIVQTRFYPFPDTNVHTHEERGNLRNKNKMLHPKKKEHYAPATGIKAGYTTKSLHTFAASAKKDGHEVIAVLLRMKSKSAMYADLKKLLEYGLSRFKNRVLIEKDFLVEELEIPGGNERLRIVSGKRVERSLPIDLDSDTIRKSIHLRAIDLPVSPGQKLGTIRFSSGGVALGEGALVAENEVLKKLSWKNLKRYILSPVPLLALAFLMALLILWIPVPGSRR
jgi:D-alanyl-D-alanine carboxypeptidase (penicillin-binding protein 5/6)